MNQQDKKYVESIYNVFRILPEKKKEYLMGFADGMAAMVVDINAQPLQTMEQPRK